MKPFECLGDDDRIYLHQDNWRRWRDDRLSVHPGEGKWRFDLELINPRETLEEVPVTNERVHYGYPPHTCFYECSDWSTIYGVHGPHGLNSSYRMIVESQNPEPLWGEQITLLASSTYFKCEPWGTNVPNQFAYFRRKYWQVIYSELLYHEFPAGAGYPLRDGRDQFGVIPRRGTVNPILDIGYFYAPPNTFNARQGILTRYGRRRLLEEGAIGPLGISFPQPEFKLDWRKYGF